MALALGFLGANPEVRPEGRRQGTGKVNYLIGNDPTKWHTGLPTYREIVDRELWPGVDMVFQETKGQLKYEFVLQPGAKLEAMRLAYRGADGLSLDEAENLLIRSPLGVFTDERPQSYQEIAGKRVSVESRFRLGRRADGEAVFDFAVGAGYDPRYPLVIDPGLVYSTYSGRSNVDDGSDIAVDAGGNAYVTGLTSSTDFPTTPGARSSTSRPKLSCSPRRTRKRF